MSTQKRETNKKIHDHMRLVAKLNTVLAGVALAAVCIVIVVLWMTDEKDDTLDDQSVPAVEQQPTPQPTPVADAVGEQVLTEEEIATAYRADVNATIGNFGFDDSARAEQLSYAVLELYAPRELRTMHLQVVVALQEAQQGKSKAARNRIQQIRNQYDWFLPDFQ